VPSTWLEPENIKSNMNPEKEGADCFREMPPISDK
jgi:hypothetical protein